MQAMQVPRKRGAGIKQDDAAATGVSAVGSIAMIVLGVVLAAVVGIAVLAAVAPTFAGNVANLSGVFSAASWGDSTADSISPIFGMAVSLAGVSSLALLAFGIMRIRKSGS